MKVRDALKEIARGGSFENDVRFAAVVSDILRARGITYAATVELVAKYGIDAQEWEALMYEADNSAPA